MGRSLFPSAQAFWRAAGGFNAIFHTFFAYASKSAVSRLAAVGQTCEALADAPCPEKPHALAVGKSAVKQVCHATAVRARTVSPHQRRKFVKYQGHATFSAGRSRNCEPRRARYPSQLPSLAGC